MKRNYFNRKIRQFRYLSSRVNHLIINGGWEKLSADSRKNLILKLNALYRQLRQYFSSVELKKILAAAAIFIGFPLVSQSQSFDPPRLNPFGLVPDSAYFASPAFADIDHDGDLDLFSGNYGSTIQFYENTGTVNVPQFGMPLQNPFGINPPANYIAMPAFADLDQDGDLDLLIGQSGNEGNYFGNFQYFENTGTNAAPAFAAPQANPFGLTPAFIFAMPEFADIDNDGDMDLFAGEGYGNMKFYENTGTVAQPAFAPPLQNPFGITPAYTFGSPAFADIDHDGDLDLMVGEYYGNFLYFENTGTAGSPSFAPVITNPFGLVQTNMYNFPAFADLDDDGDDDIMVGEYYGSFQYFKNTEINIGISENTGEALFDLYPNPATEWVFINLKDKNPASSCEISIIDLNGRKVKTLIINTNDLRLKTNDLSPGSYFVRLVTGDEVFTRKLIVR